MRLNWKMDCERTMYNYINSGLFLKINKSHLLYNKKDGRSIGEREIKYFYAYSYCLGEKQNKDWKRKNLIM